VQIRERRNDAGNGVEPTRRLRAGQAHEITAIQVLDDEDRTVLAANEPLKPDDVRMGEGRQHPRFVLDDRRGSGFHRPGPPGFVVRKPDRTAHADRANETQTAGKLVPGPQKLIVIGC
jgi:hypothetical protein